MEKNIFKILLCLFLFTPILAEDLLLKLDEIVVSTKKSNVSLRTSGKTVRIISSEDIEKSGATKLTEVLQGVPGLFTGDGVSNSGTLDLRGQGESGIHNVLIIVDGISLNTIDMSGANLNLVQVDNIERIEILPSYGGVLYGDKALGGLINIISKSQSKNETIIKTEYASFNTKKYSLNTALKYKNTINSLEFFDNSSNGYRDNSDSNSRDFIAKSKIYFGEKHLLQFYVLNHNDDYGMPGSLSKSELESDPTQSLYSIYDENWNKIRVPNKDHASNKQNKFQLAYNYNSSLFSIENNTNFNKRDYKSTGSYPLEYTTNLISNNLKFNFNNLEKTILVLGFDFSLAESENANNKINKDSLADFISFDYKVNDQLKLHAGQRVEYTKLSYYTGKKETFTKGIMEFGLNYLYSYTGNIHFNFNQTYRTPLVDEYFEKGYPLYGTADHYNEDLKPQSANTLELGFNDIIFNSLLSSNIFYTLSQNEIFYNPDTSHNSNMDGENTRYGLEFALMQNYGVFTFNETFSHIKSKISSGVYKNKEIAGVPANLFSFTLNMNPVDEFNLNLHYRYIGEQYAISNNKNIGGKLDAYDILELNSSYTFKNYTISGGIKNLLNKEYYNYVTYYNSSMNYYPGNERSFYLGLKAVF